LPFWHLISTQIQIKPREEFCINKKLEKEKMIFFEKNKNFKSFLKNNKDLILSGLVLFIAITATTFLKLNSSLNLFGDSAMNYAMLENVVKKGFLFNPIWPSLHQWSFVDSLYTKPINFFTEHSFNFDGYDREILTNHLRFHFYIIVFLLAPAAKAFNAPFIVNWVNAFSFFGILFLGYHFLRAYKVSFLIALSAIITLTFNPAWSQSLFQQPFYDRLYMVLSFALILLCIKDKFSIPMFLVFVILSSIVVEKALIYNAIFLFSYVALNYQNLDKVRIKYFSAASLVCFLFFYLVTKFYLNNPYYQSAIPHSLNDLVNRILEIIANDDQRNKTITLLISTLPLLLPSLFFAFRFFIIALIMLMPNIIGNIGGAEKIGFYTHYHSLYFSFLSAAFFIAIKNFYFLRVRFSKLIIFLYLLLTVFFYNFFSINEKNLYVFKHTHSSYIHDTFKFYKTYGTKKANEALIASFVPLGAHISVTESAMPYVYNYNNISFFPYNYENSDFLILQYSIVQGKNLPYFMTFLGEDHNVKSRLAIYNRLVDAGFKLEKPLATSSDFMIIGK